MFARRKLKELFARDAMQPLIDGSTNEQVISSTNENTKSSYDFFFLFLTFAPHNIAAHICLDFIFQELCK
jgi:hypothetical protein